MLAHSPRRLTAFISALGITSLILLSVKAAETFPLPVQEPATPATPKPSASAPAPETRPLGDPTQMAYPMDFPLAYFEAVKAQHQALRERSQGEKTKQSPPGPSTFGDNDPLDSPCPEEDLLKERENYREAVKNRHAAQQEAFRAYRRWLNPQGEYLRDLQQRRRDAVQAQIQAEREYWEQIRKQENDPSSWYPPPFGWNNPWYYRGY